MKNNFIYLIIFTTFTIAQDFATLGASLKTASLLERRGDIDGAIAIYKGILEKNSNHRSSLQKLKSIYMNYQRFEEGIEFLRGRLPKEPNNMKLFSELGEFYYVNEQKQEALAVWSKGLSKFKNNRSIYRLMVSMYGKYGLDDDIITVLGKGRKKFGKSFLSYESGVYYQARRAYDKAMEQFILHLIHETNQSGIIERRILLMSDQEGALPIIENKLINASKEKPEKILNVLSEFYFKQQNYNKAFKVKMDWSSLGKQDLNEWLTFANDLRKERQYQYSINAYNYILKKNFQGNYAGKVLLGLAQTFEDQIVPESEANLIPYFFDNNIFFEDPFQIYSSISNEHLSSSLALYDSMLVSINKSALLAEAYYKLGEIQYRILQDFDKAYMLFNRALKSNPDKKLKLKITLRISDVLLARGESNEALGYLKRQLIKNPMPSIELKKILVHFLVDDPDSTIKIVDESLFKISPLDGSFNDLMELKNFLTTYCSTSDDKTTISHFLKAEYYLRQKKIGDAIRELVFINDKFASSKIAPLANLRISLLYYRLKDYKNALQFASKLESTEFADKGIILSGQIYEKNIFNREKALEKYMLILDEYPSSIFSEPIRYHIRELKQLES